MGGSGEGEKEREGERGGRGVGEDAAAAERAGGGGGGGGDTPSDKPPADLGDSFSYYNILSTFRVETEDMPRIHRV